MASSLASIAETIYFMPVGQFYAGIGPAIFRIVRRAIEAHVSNPFLPPFLVIIRFCFRLIEMDAANIVKKTVIKAFGGKNFHFCVHFDRSHAIFCKNSRQNLENLPKLTTFATYFSTIVFFNMNYHE
ncbi:MAG: hypothetical protein IKX59_05600 [Bacteroidales bacterium]|nr:hypothetical protein [Bacteroidales bacterium]